MYRFLGDVAGDADERLMLEKWRRVIRTRVDACMRARNRTVSNKGPFNFSEEWNGREGAHIVEYTT